jgi:hypothetical protein
MTYTIDQLLFSAQHAAFIVADDVVKLILPLKAEEFRCYNDYFDSMISYESIYPRVM